MVLRCNQRPEDFFAPTVPGNRFGATGKDRRSFCSEKSPGTRASRGVQGSMFKVQRWSPAALLFRQERATTEPDLFPQSPSRSVPLRPGSLRCCICLGGGRHHRRNLGCVWGL